jgi:hypothetical protein
MPLRGSSDRQTEPCTSVCSTCSSVRPQSRALRRSHMSWQSRTRRWNSSSLGHGCARCPCSPSARYHLRGQPTEQRQTRYPALARPHGDQAVAPVLPASVTCRHTQLRQNGSPTHPEEVSEGDRIGPSSAAPWVLPHRSGIGQCCMEFGVPGRDGAPFDGCQITVVEILPVLWRNS